MSVLESSTTTTSKLIKNSELKNTPIKRRTKGEKTREKILIAAIDVLALNGIKGTTHRAIASHAELQLSLTTYYFKDIHALIEQAFSLNSTRILSKTGACLDSALMLINDIDKKELKKTLVKDDLCQQLSELITNYLIDNIKHQAISLAVSEVQVSPRLRLLTQEHDLAQRLPYEQLCANFNKVDATLDAKIMHTVFSQLQYSQLTNQINIDTKLIKQTVTKVIVWIIGLK